MDDQKKQINNKLLPIYTPILATSRPQIDILSLFDNTDKNIIWFITYFLSLSIEKGSDTLLFTDEILSVNLLDICPILNNHLYDLEMILKRWNSFSDFIFEQIDRGYYIYAYTDIYYIEAYKLHYNKNHITHPMLIFGYNKAESIVYAQDFFYYALEQSTIKVQQLEDGIKNFASFMQVSCFKKKKFHHSIDLQFMLKVLQCHLESRSIYDNDIFLLKRNINKYVFGLDCYNELKNNLQRLRLIGDEIIGNEINHHTCHAIYDHCMNLYAFIQYLYRRNYLSNDQEKDNEIRSLIEKSQIFQNQCLKYNVSKNKSLLQKIINILSQIQEKEELLLRTIYEETKIFYNSNSTTYDNIYDFTPMWDIGEADLYDEDNILFTITGNDPVLMNNMMTIDTSIMKYIYIKFRSTCISEMAQILFGITNSNICEENSVLFTYSLLDGNITYIIDMTCCKNWKGMIYIIRFDPTVFNNKNGNGEIKLLNFEISDKLPVYNSASDFCNTQGVNGWFYYSYNRGITYKELIWDNDLWRAHNIEELEINNTYQTSYHNVASVRKWVCPAGGNYEVCVEYNQRADNNLVEFKIKYDLQIILQKKYKDDNTKLQGTYETKINMKIGEALFFEFYNASQHENEYFDIDIHIKKIE